MARFKVKRDGITAGFGLRQLNTIAREVSQEVGLFWHRNYLDKHFTPAGAREYRAAVPGSFVPRSGEKGSGRRFQGSYQERKWKLFGHGNPLEYSGESHLWLKFPRLRITATNAQSRLRILLGAPNFNRFGSGGRYGTSKVDMSKDITAITDRETEEMTMFAGDEFLKRYKSLRTRNAA